MATSKSKVVLAGTAVALGACAAFFAFYRRRQRQRKQRDAEIETNIVFLYRLSYNQEADDFRWDEGPINDYLANSRRSIDLCIGELTDSHLALTLISRVKSGVQLRIILHGSQTPECKAELLADNGAVVRRVTETTIRHKFMLFDCTAAVSIDRIDPSCTALLGDLNVNGNTQFLDNIIVSNNQLVTHTFAVLFEELWKTLQ